MIYTVSKKINLIIALLSILWFSVIILPDTYNLRWKIARILLIIIVFSRPLEDILPRIWIFKKIVCIRKWLGILCWSAALAHGIWYFIFNDIAIINIFVNGFYRSVNNLIWWWIRAMVFMIPPLITSNMYSITRLWKNWKLIQSFTYLTFIATAIHVYFVKHESRILLLLWAYILIYILAFKKIIIWKSKNPS
jgi:DMSO/TMAO reductase YedYZ heme-binding membrane subunit